MDHTSRTESLSLLLCVFTHNTARASSQTSRAAFFSTKGLLVQGGYCDSGQEIGMAVMSCSMRNVCAEGMHRTSRNEGTAGWHIKILLPVFLTQLWSSVYWATAWESDHHVPWMTWQELRCNLTQKRHSTSTRLYMDTAWCLEGPVSCRVITMAPQKKL